MRLEDFLKFLIAGWHSVVRVAQLNVENRNRPSRVPLCKNAVPKRLSGMRRCTEADTHMRHSDSSERREDTAVDIAVSGGSGLDRRSLLVGGGRGGRNGVNQTGNSGVIRYRLG